MVSNTSKKLTVLLPEKKAAVPVAGSSASRVRWWTVPIFLLMKIINGTRDCLLIATSDQPEVFDSAISVVLLKRD